MLNLNRVQTTSSSRGSRRGCMNRVMSAITRMSNKTTFAVYVGFVVAVAFLLLGYWKASTERLVLRDQLKDQSKLASTAELKLANAADQLRKQLEEANGQIETLNHEKGELEGKVRDGELVVKEKESLKERYEAVNDNLKSEKGKAEKLDQEKKKLGDEVNVLKSKVTNLSKTLNSTIAKHEEQAAAIIKQQKPEAAGKPGEEALQLNAEAKGDTEPKKDVAPAA